jgi:hypothetical protein
MLFYLMYIVRIMCNRVCVHSVCAVSWRRTTCHATLRQVPTALSGTWRQCQLTPMRQLCPSATGARHRRAMTGSRDQVGPKAHASCIQQHAQHTAQHTAYSTIWHSIHQYAQHLSAKTPFHLMSWCQAAILHHTGSLPDGICSQLTNQSSPTADAAPAA